VTCGYAYVLVTRDDVRVIRKDDPESSLGASRIVTVADDAHRAARESCGQ